MLVLVVYVAGFALTSLPAGVYLSDAQTHIYFFKCATLLTGVGWVLPGVFEHNPYKEIVNGSLWTLPYECGMYGLILLLWLVGRRLFAPASKGLEFLLVVITLLLGGALILARFKLMEAVDLVRLAYMFFGGAAFYAFRERIVLSRHMVIAACLAGILALLVGSRAAFYVIYIATLAYIVFFLAYVPAGWIRAYNKTGDYSYGVYIYAFPVQQSIAAILVGVGVPAMIVLSSAVTIGLAMLSWHFVEQPALRLKGRTLDA
jgi:peptidoglycan/LPS O-acetylase OafA/YrhL